MSIIVLQIGSRKRAYIKCSSLTPSVKSNFNRFVFHPTKDRETSPVSHLPLLKHLGELKIFLLGELKSSSNSTVILDSFYKIYFHFDCKTPLELLKPELLLCFYHDPLD